MQYPKKEIYLIRHGETDYNKKGIVQGSGIDAPLNETGWSQAKAFFQKYKNIPFKRVYTSALVRTHQTVAGFLDEGIHHTIVPELNEISWGVKEGIAPTTADTDYYNWILTQWQQGQTHLPVEGGESPEEVAIRLMKGMERILADPEELVLVAMHGRAMRILLAMISGLPLSQMDTFPHQNTCLYHLEYNIMNSKFHILKTNDISHLY